MLLHNIFHLTVWLIVINHANPSSALRILGLFPYPGKSHVDVFVALMKGLAEKGHQVTVVSHFPLDSPLPRYRDISLKDTFPPLLNAFDVQLEKSSSKWERFSTVLLLDYFSKTFNPANFKTKQVQDLIKSQEQFDLIVAEFFNSESFLAFAYKFDAPIVGLSSCTILPWTNSRLGNPDNPSYIPNNFMVFGDRMTFWERLQNFLGHLSSNLIYSQVMLPHDDQLVRQYFGPDYPPLKDIVFNYTSLLLVNTHYSLNLPRPLVPGVIEVGGIHAIKKPKSLPKHIEKWINESEHGVIYFSLGSIIKGHSFPEDKRRAFLKAFARLPQRVLWKWETETMPGKPDNVMIQKWMPQADILSHPNVRAFIAHGGLLGTIEAVHHGVPLVVMPQFGDQFTNAKAVEASGGGVILELHSADEEKIYDALKTVLEPSFRKGAKELSARFRDRPLPPLETAIYWVEYVARHRGARHLRTAAVDMPLYQYLLLDVIAFLLAVATTLLLIVIFIARMLYLRLFRRKIKTTHRQKKNN